MPASSPASSEATEPTIGWCPRSSRLGSTDRTIDRLRLEYQGRPVGSIKPALKRLFERRGGKITEPELSQYAEMISGGTKIEFKPGQLKFCRE
jgi:hypothetical protein